VAIKKAVKRPGSTRPDVFDTEAVDNEQEQKAGEEEVDVDTDGADDDSPEENNDDNENAEEQQPPAEESRPRMMGAPRDGRTFAPGDKILFKAEARGGLLVVQEPVYRGAIAPNSTRWRYHLLLGKGAEIPASKAKQISQGEYESTLEKLY
jgi:hypothetical protein